MKNETRLIELFLTLAKIDGISGNEKAVKLYISDFLSKLGYTPLEDSLCNYEGMNCGNLTCKIGTGGDLILLSHMDTARSTLNLKEVITNDRILSDGTTVLGVDDRVGIAVLLYSLEKLILEKQDIKDFTLGFTVCEETTLLGSQKIQIDKNLKYGFVFDSSYRPGHFIYRTPGAKGFTVKITGKASHSGIAPEKGINAIMVACQAVSHLDWGRIDDETTANTGTFKGGTAINVVPEFAEIIGEVRSFNDIKAEERLALIENEFIKTAEFYGAKLEFSSVWDFKPYNINENMIPYKILTEALLKAGLTPNPTTSFGGSDANSLNARGLTTINIGIGAQNPHSNDEFILLEDLFKSAEIAQNLMRK